LIILSSDQSPQLLYPSQSEIRVMHMPVLGHWKKVLGHATAQSHLEQFTVYLGYTHGLNDAFAIQRTNAKYHLPDTLKSNYCGLLMYRLH